MKIKMMMSLSPLSLNGSWEFRFDEGKSCLNADDASFAATGTMVVPGCYDLMPNQMLKRGTGLYRRTFTLDVPVENAWLVIDGMGLTGRFAIDGRDLGTHPYPYARLELETGPLAAGEHTVFAALDNRFDVNIQRLSYPFYDFYQYGGFYHGVSLSFDNRKLFVRTRDYRTGKIEIEVRNEVCEGERTLVFDGTNEVKATFANNRACVMVPDFRLWSPEHPNLHTVSLKPSPETDDLSLNSKFSNSPTRFGIRSFEAKDRKLWLNGKPIYLKGVNRHESYPTFGAATPEAIMLHDIQNVKALGGNFIRGAHYQQSQRFLDLCDENGVLVWEESLGWGNGYRGEFTDETFVSQQIWQTRNMVRSSFNHPCVVIFAFMNEFCSNCPEGKQLADKLISAIRAEDSGRLVTFACNYWEQDISNEHTDLIAFNTYPGWIGSDPGTPEELKKAIETNVAAIVNRFRKDYPDKPVIVSEMGTCGIRGHRDPTAAQWTEDFQAEYVGDVIDTVFGNAEICGLTIWQLTDARSYHRTTGVRSKPLAENLAGLYDGYRRPKLAADVVKKLFSK